MTSPLRLVWRLAAVADLRDLPRAVADALAPDHPGTLLVDLADLAGPFDAGDVDALARAALIARRRGWTLQVAGDPPALGELIELAGLGTVLLEAPPPR